MKPGLSRRQFVGQGAALGMAAPLTGAALPHFEQRAALAQDAPVYHLGVPTEETAQQMRDELTYQRAVQMYLWGLPAVGMQQYRMANAEAMGGSDEYMVGYLGELLKSNILHLTGNPDSVYVDYFFDTHDGPIVLEVPDTVPGLLDDMWELPVIDIVSAVSPEGKYLIVPPDWEGEAPDGLVVAQPKTYVSWLFLRGAVAADGSTTAAVDEIEKIRIYPLSELGQEPSLPLTFVDLSNDAIDRIPPDGLAYFTVLGALVENEYPRMQEPYVMGLLATLGMAPGQPFAPDERMQQILTRAAETGRAMAASIGFRDPSPERFVWPDRNYVLPFVGGSPSFEVNGQALHDARTAYFFFACATSQFMASQTPGQGQAYPSLMMDKDGNFFNGGKTYLMHLPPDVPAKLYWSVTLYDTVTRSLLENGTPASRISTFTGPVANDDGSIDLYFGPEPIPGKEANCITTVPEGGWFFLFRLYGPEEAYFDGTWKPDDLVEVDALG